MSLVPVEDDDFEWMLASEPTVRRGLRLPGGGVDDSAVLGHVRSIVARVRREWGGCGSWMIVCDGEVVGLCSYKRAPVNGEVEIGYGIAQRRRRLGHMSRAIALVVANAQVESQIHAVTAETALGNVASQRALEKNGFTNVGRRMDDEDGELILWRRTLSSP